MMHYEEMIKRININDQPLVSIITPLYNAEKYIEETILSIQNQSYSNWEHLIVDDASQDNSILITEKLASKDSRIQLIKQSNNNGAAYCRNQATKMANGTYIAFLDSDDLWHPNKLREQIQFMITNKHLVTYTSYLLIDQNGQSLNKRIIAIPSLSYKKQHRNNYVGNLTGMYNAEILGKIVAPNIRKRQDWAVWLEAIKRSNKPAKGLQKDLAFYRLRDGSISSNKRSLIKHNYYFYKNYLGHSGLMSFFYLLRFFFEYFFIRTKQIKTINRTQVINKK